MIADELAALHPRLYHVTAPGAWECISRLGLMPACRLVEVFGEAIERNEFMTRRRPKEVPLTHAVHGTAILTDNAPLSETALAKCLDDELTPSQWLGMLNARVFFWADERRLQGLLDARTNRTRPRDVLMFDTLALARAHASKIEISPINSGSTIHRPARRGLSTFTPLLTCDYPAWQRQRGQRDRIAEVVVKGSIPDIAHYYRGMWPAGSSVGGLAGAVAVKGRS